MSLETLLDRPIAFQRAFMNLGVGVTGALLLSQAVYWSSRTGNDEKWFYKTIEEWTEETGLSRHEQDGARKKLKAKGILEIVKKGLPCRTYYRINFDKLAEALGVFVKPFDSGKQASEEPANKYADIRQTGLPNSDKQVCQTPTNSDAEKRQAITEITSKITTEITSEINLNTCSPPANDRMTNQNYLKSRFNEFYEAYQKKVNRQSAEKAFLKITLPSKQRECFVNLIIDKARLWADLFVNAQDDQKVYQPHPASWINGKRWDDESLPVVRQTLPVNNVPNFSTSPKASQREQVNDCLTDIQDTNW